ncbi:MAG: hypothetical protein LKF72_05275 [Atopobiaceae bacterium]|nr:hypothetical protein [Atopobiaceae bacterium]
MVSSQRLLRGYDTPTYDDITLIESCRLTRYHELFAVEHFYTSLTMRPK